MDITQFFKKDKIVPNEKYKLITKLQRLKINGQLSMNEYEQLITFITNNGPISQMHNIGLLLKKIHCVDDMKNTITHYMTSKNDTNNIIKLIRKKSSIEFSKSQLHALNEMIQFLYDPTKLTYGLYGYAGTGKTTLITEFIYFLRNNKFIQNVALNAPTNQAVNILKCKMNKLQSDKNDNKLDFLTIHKFLKYESDFDFNGGRIFIKTKKGLFEKYNIVLIDETSMISKKILKDIAEDIKTCKKNNFIPKVICVGDPAQLSPVNESVSPIFMNSLDKTFNIDMSYTLTDIVRNNDTDINKLCNQIRKWIFKEIDSPNITSFKSSKIHFYNKKKGILDINSKWMRRYLKNINDSIILTWTNRKTIIYNNYIRKKFFKKKDLKRFEIGDKLIFTEYYKVPILDEILDVKKQYTSPKFYTSEQIIIQKIDILLKNFDKIDYNLPASKRRLQDGPALEKKYRDCIDKINSLTKRRYKMYKLTVTRMFNSNSLELEGEKQYEIYVLHETSQRILEKDRLIAQTQIKNLWEHYRGKYRRNIDNIIKYIIKPLWRRWHSIFVAPFACVDYGNARTCHKSQGSTYYNAFIDLPDILSNPNDDEARRCVYVGCTRAANGLYILLPGKI